MTVHRPAPQSFVSDLPAPRSGSTFLGSLTPDMLQASLRVCLFVGTLLFVINHGAALSQGEMSRDRWLSGILTYCVPFSVSLHGQCMSRRRWARSAQD